MKRYLNNREMWPLVAIAVFCIGISWGHFHDVSFWDETKVYLKPLYLIYLSPIEYFTKHITLFDRPWGLHFAYLPLLYIFGFKLWLVRVLNLVYALAGLFCFWKVTARASYFAAGLSITLFLLNPITQAYLVQYVSEIQVFVLFSIVLYLLSFHPQKIGWIFATAFYAGTVRETCLALIPAIAFYKIMEGDRRWRLILLLSIAPLLGLSLHLMRNLLLTNHLFYHYTIESGDISPFSSIPTKAFKLTKGLLSPYRLIPLAILSFGFAVAQYKKIRLNSLLVFCMSVGGCFLLVFSSHRYVIPRYYMAAVPFILYLLAWPISLWAIDFKKKFAVMLILLLSLFWIGDPGLKSELPFHHFSGYQDTSRASELRALHVRVVSDLKKKVSSGDVVVTSWPFLEILKSEFFGYGPSMNLNVKFLNPNEPPPKVILWNNFPEQFSLQEAHPWMSLAKYELVEYSLGSYQVKMYYQVEKKKK